MSPNRRIVLNIVATYGRSLFSLFCGLFTARWVMMSLGQSDYGLYGVIGGLTSFVTFFNGILSSAIGRFYAVSVGVASVSKEGLEDCRRWFATAVTVHTILPLVLVVIGYPLGAWAVRNFLTISLDRIEVCIWVWRFSCIGCLIGMVSAPFYAMYRAKQEIAELTLYSVVATLLGFFFVWYMVEHPRDWLWGYSLAMMLIGVVPSLIIVIRACIVYPECKFRNQYFFDVQRICQLVGFAGWQVIGSLGLLCKGQGLSIIVNKCFGPVVNAANTVGQSLSDHCNQLSASLVGAFSPAVMNAYGAGDVEQARKLAFRACKFATLFIVIFAIPLILEVDEVLRIWLKNPPEYAADLGVCVMISVIINKLSIGYEMIVFAKGRIAAFESFIGLWRVLTLPLALILITAGYGVYSIGWAIIITKVAISVGRVLFGRQLLQMRVGDWFSHILLPFLVLISVAVSLGFVIQMHFEPSFVRILITTSVVELALLLGSWFILLEEDERSRILLWMKSKGISCLK